MLMIIMQVFRLSVAVHDFEPRGIPPLQPIPDAHAFNFTESFSLPNFPSGPGRWVYDWPSRRGVIYHGIGSIMFCSPNDPMNQPCFMLFQPDALWVLYQNNTCCKLCEPKDGCGLLRPDFLSSNINTTYQGAQVVNGEICYGYGVPGAVTLVDSWWTRDDGKTACLYHEAFSNHGSSFSHDLLVHNGTFTEKVNYRELVLPPVCTKDCARMFPFGPEGEVHHQKFWIS